MTDSNRPANAFEFVSVASQRARQLLSGCTPRTSGSDKAVRLAQLEVREGLVDRLETTGRAPAAE